MSIKNKVFTILNSNSDTFISGNDIAKILNVTRSAIWKAIKSLELDGYEIISSTNKGYMLLNSNDMLSKDGIEKFLDNKNFYNLIVHSTVTSTNDLMKDIAIKGGNEGTVLISSNQTKGRGRFGRSFYSPKDTGIYFSILLRPSFEAINSTFITSMSGIVVCNTLKNNLNIEPKIKWVNDIFLASKKISGILTEASFTIENFDVDYIIVGIGINIYKPNEGFPLDMNDTASYILENKIPDLRNRLLANMLDEFYKYYSSFDLTKISTEYKNLSCVIGKKILILEKNMTISALVNDIDEQCRLIVTLESGERKILSSGEISVKIID